MNTALEQEISRLSLAQKLLLVSQLWQDVNGAPAGLLEPCPTDPRVLAELDSALDEFERDPGAVSPWSEVRARIANRRPT